MEAPLSSRRVTYRIPSHLNYNTDSVVTHILWVVSTAYVGILSAIILHIEARNGKANLGKIMGSIYTSF